MSETTRLRAPDRARARGAGRTPRRVALLVAGALALASVAAGQTVLSPGDIGVVTSDGFFLLRADPPQAQPVNRLLPGDFDPALVALAVPRIDWERGTDAFLVSSGPDMYRVTVTSDTTATVTGLTPDVGPPASFTELDVHPGTGDVYLLDQGSQQVFRFVPPFAPGMTPDLVLPSGAFNRAMCVDSRRYPPSVSVANPSSTKWLPLDGSAALGLATAGGASLDADPRFGQHVLAKPGQDLVDLLIPPSTAVINLNIMFGCSPVVLAPANVAMNAIDAHAYVLAAEGVNPECPLGVVVGGNHVVALPPAQSAMSPPRLLTDPGGSGITGIHGDLALVLADFAFPSIYGLACDAPGTGTPVVLDCNAPPHVGSSTFALEIDGAPPRVPIHLIVGFRPVSLAQPSGCTVLVLAHRPPFPIGVTDEDGELTVVAPIPAGTPVGAQVYLQCALADAGAAVLSNGLALHFGP